MTLRESGAWLLVNKDRLTLREGAAKEEGGGARQSPGSGGQLVTPAGEGAFEMGALRRFCKMAFRWLLCGGQGGMEKPCQGRATAAAETWHVVGLCTPKRKSSVL